MACQGPDLDAARKFGKDVAEALLEELVQQYSMADPTKFPKGARTLPNSIKRWNKAKSAFVKSVQDLFEEDASNGF